MKKYLEVQENNIKYYRFAIQDREQSCFIKTDNSIYLKTLFGIPCDFSKYDSSQRVNQITKKIMGLDIFNIDTTKGHIKENEQICIGEGFTDNGFFMEWNAEKLKLHIKTCWEFCSGTGIFRRIDTIQNIGKEAIVINKCLASYSFPPGLYEIYSQGSSWCRENQGRWQRLYNGIFELKCEGGRTTQGNTPFISLRDSGQRKAMSFHLLPCGNWIIRVITKTDEGESLPNLTIEMGMSDRELKYRLEPNEFIEMPEILMQGLEKGEPYSFTSELHEFILKNVLKDKYKPAPVAYNTWFDDFDYLDVQRLRKQLIAAKEAGCEVFTVDAGWYGIGEGNWSEKVGDWRERTDSAFYGRMLEFSEEVRKKGLGFGLWIEPERVGSKAPILKEHPEWLIKSDESYYYPDFTKEEVYNYFLGVISGLIEKFKISWFKLDFNFEIKQDPYEKELYGYYKAFYKLLSELKEKYPNVFLEGCSSGAMRLDLNALSYFDGHFLSDNVNPKDVLRIYQNSILRLPPGFLIKWPVLRSIGKSIPQYGIPIKHAKETIVTPMGATWEMSETINIDFAFKVCLSGMIGLSGDIAGLSMESIEGIKQYIEFYKTWRKSILRSKVYFLIPPRNIKDNNGWAAYQLQDIEDGNSLMYVYRLDDSVQRQYFRLYGLECDSSYKVSTQNMKKPQTTVITGRELMRKGIELELSTRFSAEIIVVEAM